MIFVHTVILTAVMVASYSAVPPSYRDAFAASIPVSLQTALWNSYIT